MTRHGKTPEEAEAAREARILAHAERIRPHAERPCRTTKHIPPRHDIPPGLTAKVINQLILIRSERMLPLFGGDQEAALYVAVGSVEIDLQNVRVGNALWHKINDELGRKQPATRRRAA